MVKSDIKVTFIMKKDPQLQESLQIKKFWSINEDLKYSYTEYAKIY